MKSLKVFMLIGDPVAGSLSPAMMNAAFKKLRLNHIYVAVRVPENLLGDAIAGTRKMGIAGLNVTIPHKIAVMKFLDALDESAALAGAVNTIKNSRGKLVGFNTDGEGALRYLEEKVGKVKGKRVLLLGAGGAARAIAFSLLKAGAELSIANRTVSRAKELASLIEQKLGKEVPTISIDRRTLKRFITNTEVLINATSVGMRPRIDETLVTAEMMHRNLTVYDIVYKPIRTRLLLEAEKAGAMTVDGLGMLVRQGALAFEIWTGKRAPIKVMEDAVRREIGKVVG
ncbi:MAG: shikimate dehydrogenase [Candidatus Hadarchaeum sp.]|uniref:shikimate dehydrogenase n=1 Tax=Candidatus Hadarchaeum sp. TaxID=2883567 RepID=UPI00317A7F19